MNWNDKPEFCFALCWAWQRADVSSAFSAIKIPVVWVWIWTWSFKGFISRSNCIWNSVSFSFNLVSNSEILQC